MSSSNTPPSSGRRIANQRLSGEEKLLRQRSPHGISARPDNWNMLLWHFIIDGPANTPYEGGQYYGIIRFPENYPFGAPGIELFTPNGRFDVMQVLSVDELLGRSWSPRVHISDILSALRAAMANDEVVVAGGLMWSNRIRAGLARDSRVYNNRLWIFRQVWPQLFFADNVH